MEQLKGFRGMALLFLTGAADVMFELSGLFKEIAAMLGAELSDSGSVGLMYTAIMGGKLAITDSYARIKGTLGK